MIDTVAPAPALPTQIAVSLLLAPMIAAPWGRPYSPSVTTNFTAPDERGPAADSAASPVVRPAIVLDGVGKSFGDPPAPALRTVNLAIAPKSFVALVGGSGAGKTTLLKTINRLIEIDSGHVRVFGDDLAALSPAVLRRRIGYVFQAVGLFPHMTVAQNIGITPRLLGWPAADIDARVGELLDLVGLSHDLGARSPAALSGGQQQRVGVARALAARPSLMLMDEPFGALDPITRDALGQEYRRLHDSLGLTTVMVTHDVLEALLLADRVVVLRHGAIVADGTPRDLMHEAQDEDVRRLIDAPRRQADRLRERLGGSPE